MIRFASTRTFLFVPAALVILATGCGRSAEGPVERPAPDEQAASQPSALVPTAGISLEQDAMIPPGPPGTVNVSHRVGVHVIEWKGTRDDTIIGYEVYKRCGAGDWERIDFVALRPDDNRNRGIYVHEDGSDAHCEYTVAAVGADGKPGPKTVDIQ